jgi:hypothetical protein
MRLRSPATPWLVLFAIALIAGIFLRVYQLDTQFLLDDEWHAIHKLLSSGARDIATHLGVADYSIPLTLYYRFLYLHGGLSEWGMRLPMLLSGIALLIVAPWMTRAMASLSTRVAWTALMAISPVMIYHSRTARPYAITTLLVFVAIVAFRQWHRSADRRWPWALAYVAPTFIAGYLHLITLPFTLLPFAYYGLLALRDIAHMQDRAKGWRDLRDMLVLGVLTALLLCAAMLPPMLNDWGALAAKAGSDVVTFESAYRSLLIAFGVAGPGLFGVCVVLGAIGVRSFWKRDHDLVAYLSVVILIGMAAIAASKPAWVQHPLTYTRYIQPVVPFLLLAVAEGAIVLLARVRWPSMQAGAIGVATGALYIAGPIPGYLYNPNQFMGDAYFQFDYDPAYNPYLTLLPHGPIPKFYYRLGAQPARSLTLIETPWSLETPSDPQPLYQKVHRQYIKVALTTPLCGVYTYGNYPDTATGMRLHEFVHLSTLLQGDNTGADFLVVHLRSWPNSAPPPSAWPDVSTCLPQIEQHYGSPAYRDDDIEVFALSGAGRNALP